MIDDSDIRENKIMWLAVEMINNSKIVDVVLMSRGIKKMKIEPSIQTPDKKVIVDFAFKTSAKFKIHVVVWNHYRQCWARTHAMFMFILYP